MKRKIIGGSIALIAVFMAGAAIIGVFIGVNILKPFFADEVSRQDERRAYAKEFLAPFHEVYDALREKYPSVKSLSEHLGAGDHYRMYYIECDIDESTDCFAEFVDIQREINAHLEARKENEWFKEFEGHIEIIAGNRKLRVFYHNGSMSDAFLAEEIISDNYNVLWDAFPDNDELSLTIWLSDYSDEMASEIIQENEGKNIRVRPQLGS